MTVHVEVRTAAIEQVHRLMAGQKPEMGVRVYAQAGGAGCCGGGSGVVQFGMAFAKPRADDEVVPVDGFRLFVDPGSTKLVDGAVIDYVESLAESGFKITNPTLPEPDEGGKADGCGGCGSSSANGGGCSCGG
ncbi:MAG: iron-sulfur cluster assembly accessory protein [Thermoplasmata archaeon]|nr:iron-sulfur cluster assembly accessory protein [Thermoplasmata archaeon]